MDPEESQTPGSPQPQAVPSDESKEPAYTHTRTGKVARLPKVLRDQVNQMLLDAVPFRKIIESLGDAGSGITETNMGNWKSGGFQDWLLDLQRNQALRSTREAAVDLLDEKAGVTVQDAGRTIAGAQLYELLLSFDPVALQKGLASKPELYFRIIDCLARLSEGEAVCSHRRAQQSLLQAKLQPNTPGTAENLVTPETLSKITQQTKLL